MFYLTNSVKTGPPTQGCLAPFIDDLTDLAGNLGEALVASACFFLFMAILIWTLCCYKHEKDGDKVQPFEGGDESNEIEDNERRHKSKLPIHPIDNQKNLEMTTFNCETTVNAINPRDLEF